MGGSGSRAPVGSRIIAPGGGQGRRLEAFLDLWRQLYKLFCFILRLHKLFNEAKLNDGRTCDAI